MNYFKLLLLLVVISLGCKEQKPPTISCDMATLISESEYANAPDDQLTINNLEITRNCLRINFSSGGCDGQSWEIKLIDAGVVMESFPPQRNVRLSLRNQELCDAWIGRELTFDISNLKVEGGPVYLNITNSGDQILYEY